MIHRGPDVCRGSQLGVERRVAEITVVGMCLIDLVDDLPVPGPGIASQWRLMTDAVVVPHEPPPRIATLERFTGNISQVLAPRSLLKARITSSRLIS